MESPPSEALVVARVREFLQLNFLHLHPGLVLAEDDELLESRILDSMAVMELVMFLEDEFGVQASERDVVQANFSTLRRVASYVRSRHAPAA
jgi:acyl carrier protein